MKKYRSVAYLVIMSVMACLLTGCTKEQEVVQQEKKELSLWSYWEIGLNKNHLSEIVEEFNRKNEDFSVELTFMSEEDYRKELALHIADGDTPDMGMVDTADFRFFYEMQSMAELSEDIPALSDYREDALDVCTVDGRIYGLPFGMYCTALYYNKKMLEVHGCSIPATWDSFCDAAAELTVEEHYGVGLPLLTSKETTLCFLPVLWSFGGDVDSLDSKEGLAAYGIYERLITEGSMGKGCANLTLMDITRQFAEENLALMFNTPMVVDTIRMKNEDLDFGVTYLPSDGEKVTAVGGEIITVFQGENEKEAKEFLVYMAEVCKAPEVMDKFGFLSPRKGVMEQQFLEDEVKREFITMFKNGKARESTPCWPRISAIVCDTTREIVLGDRDMQEVLQESAQKIHNIREAEK